MLQNIYKIVEIRIKCGSVIRLKHLNTGRWLHSHKFRSPLSNQQEVSAFDGSDTGDNWEVRCDGMYQ